MKQKYYKPEWNSIDDCYEFEIAYDREYLDSNTASSAAEDFFHNHDGWESDWPLDIVLVSVKGEEYEFTVYMETVPAFTAYEKGEEDDDDF